MSSHAWLSNREKHPIVPLDDLCDLCSGITKGRKIGPGETINVPYMAVANVQDGSLRMDSVKTIDATLEEIERYRLLPGDLLLTEGGDPDKLGRGSIWNGELDICIHQNHIFRARKASKDIDMRYLAHLVSSQYGKKYFLRQSKQTTGIASINMGQLKRFPVPLPPLEEQRRIAAILDKADQINRLRTRFDSLRHQACESLYLSLFGDPIANPYTLPSLKLGEIADCQLGKMLDKKRQHGNSSRPYLRNANVRWFEVNTDDCLYMDIEESEMDRFGVLQGDLLVCEGGEPGRSAIWKGESGVYGFQKALHRIRPKKDMVAPQFLNWSFWVLAQRGLLSDHITSATISHLTREKLVTIDVLLPPMPLQKRFTQFVDKIEAVFAHSAPRQKRLESLRMSLFSEFLV